VLSAVFDTVVFVRALINPRSIWGRLIFSHRDEYRLTLCHEALSEIVEVMQRPVLSRKFRPLTGDEVERLMAVLAGAEMVDIGEFPAVSRDPKDDKYLATAALAGADYLVSEDEDLLVIGEYQGVTIVDGRTFLRLLEQRPS
jgi:putative PIN family toxin of toxin-antitoxin system